MAREEKPKEEEEEEEVDEATKEQQSGTQRAVEEDGLRSTEAGNQLSFVTTHVDPHPRYHPTHAIRPCEQKTLSPPHLTPPCPVLDTLPGFF